MSIRTVLVVDDEPDIRRIGRLSLERIGHWEVLEAATAEEALDLVVEEAPDVVLLDVMLPGMDGVELFQELTKLSSPVGALVVFMTARAQKREVKRYLDLGVAGVIEKPFDPLTLPEQIQRLVDAAKGT